MKAGDGPGIATRFGLPIVVASSAFHKRVGGENAAFVERWAEGQQHGLANKMFVTVHVSTAGNRTLQLPQSYNIHDVLAQTWLVADTSDTRVSAEGETIIFQYQK